MRITCGLALLLIAGPVHAAVIWGAPIVIEDDTAVPAPVQDGRQPFFNVANIDLKRSVYHPDFSGDLSRAFKLERTYHEQVVGTRFVKSWADWLWTTTTSHRWSDDAQVQGAAKVGKWKNLSIISSLAYKDRFDATVGNVLASYHRYAISTSLEGATLNLRVPVGNAKLEASAASGRSARGMDRTRYTRWVTGTNLALSTQNAWGPFEAAAVRLTGSVLHDDPGSADGTGIAQSDARALASRIELKILGGWTAEADYGFSTGQANVKTASRDQSGGAGNLMIAYRRPSDRPERTGWRRLIPTGWRGSYEIVSDDYFAPQSSAGADVKRWSSQSDYTIYDWLSFSSQMNRLEDNAKERRLHTNYTHSQGYTLTANPFRAPRVADFVLRRPFELDNLRLTLDFRHTHRSATNLAANTKTEDYSIGLGHTFRGWNLGSQFQLQLVDNDLAAAADRKSERWAVNAGRSWTFERLDRATISLTSGFQKSVDALRNFTNVTRNENTNVGLSMLWKGVTAGADWSRTRAKRFPFGTGSHNQNARASIGWRPSHLPEMQLNLTGTWQYLQEDNVRRNFRAREIRGEASYRF